MASRRALHFVFKVGNRTETTHFYRDVLGMKFLRHEEFEKGCDAACNGPYDGKWSKSMVGYGDEDDHFVVELTYNYGIGSYKLGNDFQGITVHSKSVLDNATKHCVPIHEENGIKFLKSPDGHRFFIKPESTSGDPVKKVTLTSSNLKKSIDITYFCELCVEYWKNKCGMTLYSEQDKTAVLGYSNNQCKLEFVEIEGKVEHATAFGRIAFSCLSNDELPEIEKTMKESNETILTPLISLDTPGKATVKVVILADPDGHEICFTGDSAFKELSQTDADADELLDKAISADKSDEWFKKKGKTKAAAE